MKSCTRARTGSTSTLEPLGRLQGRTARPSSHGRSLLPAVDAAVLCAPGAPAPIPPLTSPLTVPCGRQLGSMKERPHGPSQGRGLPCSGVVGVCSCGRWRRGGPRGPQEPRKPHLTPVVSLQVAGGCSCERPLPVERELLSRGQGRPQDQVPGRALQTPLHLLKSADPPGGPQVAPGHISLRQSPLPGQPLRAPCCTGALAGEGGSAKVEAL